MAISFSDTSATAEVSLSSPNLTHQKGQKLALNVILVPWGRSPTCPPFALSRFQS